jgi:microcystin-dependent protein
LSPYAQGQKGGTETVTLTLNQLPAHPHPANCLSIPGDQYQPNNGVWARDAAGNRQFGTTKAGTMSPNIIGPTSYGQPHNNLQPYLALNYVVAMYGVLPARP